MVEIDISNIKKSQDSDLDRVLVKLSTLFADQEEVLSFLKNEIAMREDSDISYIDLYKLLDQAFELKSES